MADRLLTAIPPSGRYRERHFGVSARSNAWVLFEPPDDDPWVGVFGDSGLATYFDLVAFPHQPDLVLVIAGGQGYIAHRRTGDLVRKTPWDCCYAALPVPDSDRIVLADPWHIWTSSPSEDRWAVASTPLYGPTGPREDDRRIATDGIVFRNLDRAALRGAYDGANAWYAFTLDLRTMVVQRGEVVAPGNPGIQASTGRGFPPSDEALRLARGHRLSA